MAIVDSNLSVGSSDRPSIRPETGVLTRRVYDQHLTDWSARYKKNKGALEIVGKECDQLRQQVAKLQAEVNLLEQNYADLAQQHSDEVVVRHEAAKEDLAEAQLSKTVVTQQLVEQRRFKAQLLKEHRLLNGDYNRKHDELATKVEEHDRIEEALQNQAAHLVQISNDRGRMERELASVHQNLRQNADVADEVNHDISDVLGGIKDSVKSYMSPPSFARSPREGPVPSPRAVGPRRGDLGEKTDGVQILMPVHAGQ
mmetsp:Transcript_47995/g.88338  ORF Transcript_47995/g.88338 Transcript_47995/m.88338 type:complete len:256 (-) Transcript_47995:136-903(-)